MPCRMKTVRSMSTKRAHVEYVTIVFSRVKPSIVVTVDGIQSTLHCTAGRTGLLTESEPKMHD